MTADKYNYTSFPVDSDIDDFATFPSVMHVGDTAPDAVLTDVDTGETVRLHDITRNGLTVVEFGSLT